VRDIVQSPDGSSTTTCSAPFINVCAMWKDPVNIPQGPWGFFIKDPVDQSVGVGYIGLEFEVESPGEDGFYLRYTATSSDQIYTDYET
jgi:hypothetical protein